MEYPGAKRYVIGHSHGGTVALQALKDDAVKQNVHGVVCLSTPFLHTRPRSFGTFGLWDTVLTPILGYLILLYYLLYKVPAISARYDAIFAFLADLPGTERFLAFLAVSLLAGLLLLPLFWLLGETYIVVMHWQLAAEHVREAVALPSLDDMRQRILLIRSSADEASAALAFFQFAVWLLNKVWFLFGETVARIGATADQAGAKLHEFVLSKRGLLACCLGLALCVGILLEADKYFGEYPTVLVLLGLIVLPSVAFHFAKAIVGFLAVPLLVFPSLLLLSFDAKLVWSGFFLETSVEPMPPGAWHVHQLASTDAPGLAHSASYESPEALALIVDTLKTS